MLFSRNYFLESILQTFLSIVQNFPIQCFPDDHSHFEGTNIYHPEQPVYLFHDLWFFFILAQCAWLSYVLKQTATWTKHYPSELLYTSVAMVKLKINFPRLFETLHLLFWILLLILFMFYINHQVISQVCTEVSLLGSVNFLQIHTFVAFWRKFNNPIKFQVWWQFLKWY